MRNKTSNSGTTHAEIRCGDALTELDKVTDGSISLIVTSPPYNIGKEYEQDERLSIEEYADWLKPIVEKLCGKVASNGSLGAVSLMRTRLQHRTA